MFIVELHKLYLVHVYITSNFLHHVALCEMNNLGNLRTSLEKSLAVSPLMLTLRAAGDWGNDAIMHEQ